MTSPHNYPHVLKWIAEGKFNNITYRMKESEEVFRFNKEHPHAYWSFLQNLWSDGYIFELIPEMMQINGHEVPEPEREAPTKGTEIYIPGVLAPESYTPFTWNPDSNMFKMFLKRGIVHLNKEGAIAHTNALLSFTEVNYENN